MSRHRSTRREHRQRPLPPLDRYPTTDEIARRAHDLFVAGGRRLTKIFEYWQRAEQELLDIAARRTLARADDQRGTQGS
jgi:hypothetical protein